jgi:hypothetical protein
MRAHSNGRVTSFVTMRVRWCKILRLTRQILHLTVNTPLPLDISMSKLGRVRAVPRLYEFYPVICLTTEAKARKNLNQGSIHKHTIRIHIHNNTNTKITLSNRNKTIYTLIKIEPKDYEGMHSRIQTYISKSCFKVTTHMNKYVCILHVIVQICCPLYICYKNTKCTVCI